MKALGARPCGSTTMSCGITPVVTGGAATGLILGMTSARLYFQGSAWAFRRGSDRSWIGVPSSPRTGLIACLVPAGVR